MRIAARSNSLTASRFSRRRDILVVATFALTFCALLCVDMATTTAKAGFFEELFGSSEQPRQSAPRHDPSEGGRPPHRASRDSARRQESREWRRHAARSEEFSRHGGRARFGHARSASRWEPELSYMDAPRHATARDRVHERRFADDALSAPSRGKRHSDWSSNEPQRRRLAKNSGSARKKLLAQAADQGSKAAATETKPSKVALGTIQNADAGLCQSGRPLGGDPAPADAIMLDATLHPGDSVMTTNGLRVFHGGGACPHKNSEFLSLSQTRDIPREKRGALGAIERAMKIPLAAKPMGI